MSITYIVISALIGGLVTYITTKLLQKRARFLVERNDEEFQKGSNLPIGSNLRIFQGEQEITNFKITKFIIKNESAHDFEKIKIRVWSAPERSILHDQIRFKNYLEEIPYHPDFIQSLTPDNEGNYQPYQIHKYNSQREYQIPFINRFDSLEILIVSTSNNPVNSDVWLEIPEKGIKVVNKYNRTFVFGVPNDQIWLLSLLLMILFIFTSVLLFDNVWIIAIFAGIGTAISSIIAALIYKLFEWFLKKLVN